MPKAVSLLAGMRFGRLSVIEFAGAGGRTRRGRFWRCACDCGKEVITHAGNLRNRNIQSCGCLQLEQRQAVCRARIRHGMCDSPEYRAYYSAKARCENPKSPMYYAYGGRGVEFKFSTFEEWYAVLGPQLTPDHSVDRIDPFGHYESSNIRWATAKEQANNTRAMNALRKMSQLEAEIFYLKVLLRQST